MNRQGPAPGGHAGARARVCVFVCVCVRAWGSLCLRVRACACERGGSLCRACRRVRRGDAGRETPTCLLFPES